MEETPILNSDEIKMREEISMKAQQSKDKEDMNKEDNKTATDS